MKRLSAYLFVFAVALAGTTSAFAQEAETSVATKNAQEGAQLSRQLILALDSPIDQIKLETLQLINFLAAFHSDEVDVTEAVPKLIEIYEIDATEGYRILALTGLHAMGERSVMRYLSETVRTERSPRVRALTLAALADYNAKEQAL